MKNITVLIIAFAYCSNSILASEDSCAATGHSASLTAKRTEPAHAPTHKFGAETSITAGGPPPTPPNTPLFLKKTLEGLMPDPISLCTQPPHCPSITDMPPIPDPSPFGEPLALKLPDFNELLDLQAHEPLIQEGDQRAEEEGAETQ